MSTGGRKWYKKEIYSLTIAIPKSVQFFHVNKDHLGIVYKIEEYYGLNNMRQEDHLEINIV